MWAYESVFYQIYPLGFCGAPFENDGILTSRISKVISWIPHIKELGANAIYFSPVFESDTHGYNTRDYSKIDVRLGTNEDFKQVCDACHKEGIKVVLDGVFNHVGRGFFAFQDVLLNREHSQYKDWFNINFNGNSCYNDGLWYEGWEGNYDLVKLNLYNPQVVDHIMKAITGWVHEFDIDGLRLDVAYCLNKDFLKHLRYYTSSLKNDFFLVGETLHGDYNQWMNEEMCHSVTNYECYKGLHSSFNSMNMFEICHSLNRQFANEQWTLYKGRHLLSFVDNHDVTRVATILNNKMHLPLIYTLMFTMPGIPIVYYGSEWGEQGDKKNGDPSLRPFFDVPNKNELTAHIAKLSNIKKNTPSLNYGSFRNVIITNHQCVIERSLDNSRIMICINAADYEYVAHLNSGTDSAIDLLTGEKYNINNGMALKPYTSYVLQLD